MNFRSRAGRIWSTFGIVNADQPDRAHVILRVTDGAGFGASITLRVEPDEAAAIRAQLEPLAQLAPGPKVEGRP